MKRQITDSETNLQAQNEALKSQKTVLWSEQENRRIYGLIEQAGLDIEPFEKLVDHMSTSGSKDTISSSKKWIFDNCQTDRLREVVLAYLFHRVQMNTASDQFRLHILYLINDWAHYCQRKKLDNVRTLPLSTKNCSEKLDKLIGVWEAYKYFDDKCYSQLRNPAAIMQNRAGYNFCWLEKRGKKKLLSNCSNYK
uniref:CID domain-containing protein n=1 Tax=Ditylenchus dipsaci TaxID=166011 RepID=A0A915DLC6_9BILA